MNSSKSSSTKYFVALGFVVVLAGLVLLYMKGGELVDSPTLEVVDENTIGLRVIPLLSQVQGLEINSALFNDYAYKTLVDYSVEVPPQGIGRPNPFDPIPGVPNPRASSPRK